jgi:hypothetical protein
VRCRLIFRLRANQANSHARLRAVVSDVAFVASLTLQLKNGGHCIRGLCHIRQNKPKNLCFSGGTNLAN